MGRISKERRDKLLNGSNCSESATSSQDSTPKSHAYEMETKQAASILLELQTIIDNEKLSNSGQNINQHKKQPINYNLVLDTQCTYLIDNSTSSYDSFLAKVVKDILTNASQGILRVQNEIKNGQISDITIVDLPDEKLRETLKSAYLKSFSRLIVEFLKMPALNELPSQNIQIMIEIQSLSMLLLQHAPLFDNNESFLIIGNSRVDRKQLETCFGFECISQVFECCELQKSLNLTTSELALIMASLFTTPNDKFENPSTMVHIHENILHALKSLFYSNDRDEIFSQNLNQLIRKLSEINR